MLTANIIRDLLVLFLIVFANILLIKCLKKIVIKKRKREISNQDAKKLNFNNCIIALIVCIMSTCIHTLVFITMVLRLTENDSLSEKLSRSISIFPVLLNGLKYALSFFIFRFLNKNFRDRCRELFFNPK